MAKFNTENPSASNSSQAAGGNASFPATRLISNSQIEATLTWTMPRPPAVALMTLGGRKAQRENFLYWIRFGMVESIPSRRFLSSS